MNRKECSGCEYHREIRYVGGGSTFRIRGTDSK